jgi:hypothetical protein
MKRLLVSVVLASIGFSVPLSVDAVSILWRL